ncbi:MAG: TniQ family protein [Roseobacter sp.]
MPLPFLIDLQPYETQTSFGSRLAAANLATFAQYFYTDVRIVSPALVRGDSAQLDRLSELGDVDRDTLQKNAVCGSAGEGHTIGDQFFEKRTLLRSTQRICPACITADIEAGGEFGAYGRSYWHMASVRTCVTHSRPLLGLKELKRPRNAHDFHGRIVDSQEVISDADKSAVVRDPTDLEKYLVSRFKGRTEYNWLNKFSIQVASKTCEMLGAILNKGPAANLAAFQAEDWLAAGSAGFAIASQGEEGFRAALTDLQRRPGVPSGGPQAHWGRFYQWLAFSGKPQSYNKMLDVVRDHIISNYPIAADETVLGKKCQRRRIHSLASAQRETGLHPKRLRTLLIEEKFLPDDAGQIQHGAMGFFDAVAADKFLRETSVSVGQPQAQKVLNISRSQFDVMRKWGFIVPVSVGQRAKPRYSLIALKEFRHHLLRNAVSIRHLEPSQADIQSAARKAVCSTGEIVTLILENQLDWIGFTDGQRSYRNLVVDVDEVMSKLKTTVVEGLTKKELKSLLGVNDCVIKWLCDEGYLPLRKSRSPTSRKSRSVVRQADLDSFNRQYITLRNLARQTRFNSYRLKSMLKQASVAPLDGTKQHGRNIYAIRDVGHILPATNVDSDDNGPEQKT